MTTAVIAARAWLAEVEAAGSRAFDASAHGFVESLLARAEALGGAAGERLAERASVRAEQLARELEGAKRAAHDALGRIDVDEGALGRMIDAGEPGRALRLAKKRAVAPPPRGVDDLAWTTRLVATARGRGVSLRGRPLSPRALAEALYEASRGELAAMLAARRAEAEVPADAGPYNPLAIAARSLAELSSRAPSYLAALIAQLDDLSPLLALPPPPPERSRSSPMPRRRTRPKPSAK